MPDGLERRVGLGIGMAESSGTVRMVKVGRTTQVRRGGGRSVVAFIRLAGKWLERAGFLEGDMIAVTAANGEIRIVRQGQQSVRGKVQGELF